jgi:hypothetical protein
MEVPCLSIYLSICLPVCPSVQLSSYPAIQLSSYHIYTPLQPYSYTAAISPSSLFLAENATETKNENKNSEKMIFPQWGI